MPLLNNIISPKIYAMLSVMLSLINVDAFYQKVIQMNLPVVKDIKSEDFRQRHFIIESPSRTLVDVIQVINSSEEYEESYIQAYLV